MIRIIAAAVIVSAAFFFTGCTERERSGYSAIPQNSPASWTMNPYGDLHN